MIQSIKTGESNATSEHHLHMGILVPALHGWSRILAYRITQGKFDHLPPIPGPEPGQPAARIEPEAREVLTRRLYTFSEDQHENDVWLAECFGDYVIEILFGGEFAIFMQNKSPWHPAEFPVVCRNPCHGPRESPRYYRLASKTVNALCGTPDWPQIRGRRSAHDPRRFNHEVTKYHLVGELDTVRKRRADAPLWSQRIFEQMCAQECAQGGSGLDWAREMFPDCEIPEPGAPEADMGAPKVGDS
ncbi:hypothetical protein F4810DRAFT_668158 [Camillea tinctor]|nr:hypothetical protein F4810DRAFT_668158 [Camillea tinctor]